MTSRPATPYRSPRNPVDHSANAVASTSVPAAGTAATSPEGQWTQLLSGVEVELSAELGRADLALGDITSLASESVLTLDQLVDEPVTVFVNGTRYATARLVVVDGEYGIEDVYLSVPATLGREGVRGIVTLPLTDAELDSLQASAATVAQAVDALGLRG